MVDRVDRVPQSLSGKAGVLEVSFANLNTISDGSKVFGLAAREVIDHNDVSTFCHQLFDERGAY
jgi:hypothetical protein